ncbi:MAG: YggS family pyridoxal phosphate-dependent enzyme [Muribaculaceae bacterium]|nr:YggS family pyridoxal phosphate-dependent enzyme [Muribaculaceae bacterium]
MMIAENIQRIQSQLPAGVHLVAVSKFHPVEALMEAYQAGQRLFGENRAQELAAKAPQMPTDVQWHFIGHLQTNKVRPVVQHATMIQSVDSARLLQLISKEAVKAGRTIDVLLQLHVAQEEAKSGFLVEELLGALTVNELQGLPAVRIRGLMAMASLTDDRDQIAREFALVKSTFDLVREEFFADDAAFDTLSMGMSDDWPIAVEHGSTHVRIGTAIFGPRQY